MNVAELTMYINNDRNAKLSRKLEKIKTGFQIR